MMNYFNFYSHYLVLAFDFMVSFISYSIIRLKYFILMNYLNFHSHYLVLDFNFMVSFLNYFHLSLEINSLVPTISLNKKEQYHRSKSPSNKPKNTKCTIKLKNAF
jgi:hypothetical protein